METKNTKHEIGCRCRCENCEAKFFAVEYIESLQEIQKNNPSTSIEWMKASKEINAVAARLANGEI